jgi:FkbM family methyltransferase
MTINLKGKEYPISNALKAHWDIPINHAQTILNQINSGMYDKWFEGKKDMVCLDIGANVGLVSLYMLQYSIEIHCVEPTPSHMELCKELINANLNEGQTAYFYQTALHDRNESVIFATGQYTENKITSPEGHGSHKIHVNGEILTTYFEKIGKQVDFCKIDVEGGEMNALTPMLLKKCFENKYCKIFFVENHPTNNYNIDTGREELVLRFTKAGYGVQRIDYQTIVAYHD